MPQKIYDSKHQAMMIHSWRRRGLILREGETYKGIYSFYINTDFCNLCNVKFNDEVHNEKKTMDHSHETGYFRQVLCMKCNKGFDVINGNNKLGHRWISVWINKSKNRTQVSFVYSRKGFKIKKIISLTKLICLSFINLLKKPV